MTQDTPNRVDQSRDGDVFILTINNPPVNAFGPGVPEGLKAGLDAAAADDSVKAVVIIGGGRTFVAGADIKGFGLPREQAPDLRGTVAKLDAFEKPTVAAIHGTALGGGLELALGCTYRVAVKDAQLGLPEVKLGVLPGAGGTQRLPRVVGAQKALEMMLSGNPIKAPAAKELGLVDEIVDGDLLAGAVAFARAHADARPLPRVSERSVEGGSPEVFAAAREGLKKTHRGQHSPSHIVDLAEMAATKPFQEGWDAEADRFVDSLNSPQSRGLRHIFFAEREAGKIRGLSKDTPTTDIKSAGIIGAGTMGGGIAMNFLNVGIPVTIVETSQEALDRGLGVIRKNYENTAKKGRMTQDDVEKRMGLLTPTLKMEDLAGADIIIEAVFENMDVKKDIFTRLDKIAKPGAILASNTSTLDVNEIASVTGRPEQVIGLHFFSPANVMKLLEIVRADKTSDSVLATSLALAKRIKKVGVVVGVCDGFVGNRMVHRYGDEARKIVEEGARPEDVDAAMNALGLPMGPFQMSDMAGLDIGYSIRQHQAKVRGEPEPDGWLDRIVKTGRKGQKTQGGIYDYGEDRKPKPNADVQKLIEDYRAEQGTQSREISQEEITKRLAYSLVNEGAKILEEGIAQRASDIDVIYIYGYGFPAYRGGPMQYASEQGLKNVAADLEKYGQTPAPVLKQLADEGKTFSDYDREHAGA
ncbi:3-hydroxyacyl-CoA dehydrogenase NAD-binding domain-containing protein [Deinococcus radiodurans]|jgi:short chain enoyl-CoA hydratase (EC 4.2.1.17)/3-hydroxyacyl-CoA dehydrogenase (EC 1.1.1.35)|nr:3-hydroxyacyl-CoA dehydrogenase NAD-binding domain-containing protein [Deinococcus radiodurans]ANC71384.1 3-hydroxyacyl-CoA dehydrogenase [Deinococcus radiodurans R1 = ATCC 13939 = DSM 20539]QIP29494.1 3-hydroxyacyl-CoA dehydrogenase [Deinococcus radiodurans]QIP31818.1 3-hydroxyacyl-CoA dehydrogenase [Deinococcus radiodurans]UID70465.1 3-hydroxyacyl-CoA dehydrogenase [Deinococcus radiodurans R1 = ATCC 13939 = DSM 20539]